MKIRMKVQMSGTRNGQRWPKVGETADIPTGEATHLVASGIAEQAPDEQPTQTATTPDSEVTEPPAAAVTEPPTATKRAGRGRKPAPAGADTAKG
ncbi:hypothetical protein [Streptomyces sp. NBC_01506]|uniref:hypothetical protein n=1 Tax=Streptomyces sp. NBC_01506 TaxID=2903887 RepID=UPI003867F18E